MDKEEGVSFCGDLLNLRCKWRCLIVFGKSWNYDFEVQKKSLKYKIGSLKVEIKVLKIDDIIWDMEVKEILIFGKEIEEY